MGKADLISSSAIWMSSATVLAASAKVRAPTEMPREASMNCMHHRYAGNTIIERELYPPLYVSARLRFVIDDLADGSSTGLFKDFNESYDRAQARLIILLGSSLAIMPPLSASPSIHGQSIHSSSPTTEDRLLLQW